MGDRAERDDNVPARKLAQHLIPFLHSDFLRLFSLSVVAIRALALKYDISIIVTDLAVAIVAPGPERSVIVDRGGSVKFSGNDLSVVESGS